MTRRRRIAKKSHDGLTSEELLEMLCGPTWQTGSVFNDDAVRRSAWCKHRRSIVEQAEQEGRPLPWAFWEFEAPEHLHAKAEEFDLDNFNRSVELITAFQDARTAWRIENRPADGWFTDDEEVDA
jgi:hypothetical protein